MLMAISTSDSKGNWFKCYLTNNLFGRLCPILYLLLWIHPFLPQLAAGSGSLNLTTGAGSNSSANLYNKTLVTEE